MDVRNDKPSPNEFLRTLSNFTFYVVTRNYYITLTIFPSYAFSTSRVD